MLSSHVVPLIFHDSVVGLGQWFCRLQYEGPTFDAVVVKVVVVVALSSLERILGECSTIHSRPLLFFFFLKRRFARAHLFHSLCQDQSTVAQRA